MLRGSPFDSLEVVAEGAGGRSAGTVVQHRSDRRSCARHRSCGNHASLPGYPQGVKLGDRLSAEVPILPHVKTAPDPVLSEVVRQRLEVLLAEVQPRHALPDERQASPQEPVDRVGTGEDLPGVVEPTQPVTGARLAGLGSGGGPVSAVGSRVAGRVREFAGEHLAAVVIVLLVGCGWTVYGMLQTRSTPVAVAAPPSVAVSPSTSATPAPEVLVHVLGAVKKPGVVTLPEGSRVGDAIAAAGGLTASADPAELNLAAVVADGAQVVIGTERAPRGDVNGAASNGAGNGSAAATISLNTATVEQLDTLPGVGPVTAQKILDWREQHGKFTAVSELQEVDGIGPKTYADIAPHVRV